MYRVPSITFISFVVKGKANKIFSPCFVTVGYLSSIVKLLFLLTGSFFWHLVITTVYVLIWYKLDCVCVCVCVGISHAHTVV